MSDNDELDESSSMQIEERKSPAKPKRAAILKKDTVLMVKREASVHQEGTLENAKFKGIKAFLISEFLKTDYFNAVDSQHRHVTRLGKVGYVIEITWGVRKWKICKRQMSFKKLGADIGDELRDLGESE